MRGHFQSAGADSQNCSYGLALNSRCLRAAARVALRGGRQAQGSGLIVIEHWQDEHVGNDRLIGGI